MQTEKDIALRSVRNHAKRTDDARQALERSIRAAHQNGASLRDIGESAGMNHQTVKNLLDRLAGQAT